MKPANQISDFRIKRTNCPTGISVNRNSQEWRFGFESLPTAVNQPRSFVQSRFSGSAQMNSTFILFASTFLKNVSSLPKDVLSFLKKGAFPLKNALTFPKVVASFGKNDLSFGENTWTFLLSGTF